MRVLLGVLLAGCIPAPQRTRCHICTLLPKARRCIMPQCTRPACRGYREPTAEQKLCDCCRCKGCGVCEELSEQDKRLVEENPDLSWLHCGGVRSGAPRCPHKHLKLKKKIHYCHGCVSNQKHEPKPKPDDEAVAAQPPTADTMDHGVPQHVGQQGMCAAQHEVAAASTSCAVLAPLDSMQSPSEHAAPAASFGGARARGA